MVVGVGGVAALQIPYILARTSNNESLLGILLGALNLGALVGGLATPVQRESVDLPGDRAAEAGTMAGRRCGHRQRRTAGRPQGRGGHRQRRNGRLQQHFQYIYQ